MERPRLCSLSLIPPIQHVAEVTGRCHLLVQGQLKSCLYQYTTQLNIVWVLNIMRVWIQRKDPVEHCLSAKHYGSMDAKKRLRCNPSEMQSVCGFGLSQASDIHSLVLVRFACLWSELVCLNNITTVLFQLYC